MLPALPFSSDKLKGCNLLLNKRQMMRNVARDAFQQSLQSQRTSFRMNAGSLKVLHVRLTQNPNHLFADHGDQIQLLFDVAILIMQTRCEDIRVCIKHRRIVFDQNVFQAVGTHSFKIGDVTNHLMNRPFARNGMQCQLFPAGFADDRSKLIGALFVLLQ